MNVTKAIVKPQSRMVEPLGLLVPSLVSHAAADFSNGVIHFQRACCHRGRLIRRSGTVPRYMAVLFDPLCQLRGVDPEFRMHQLAVGLQQDQRRRGSFLARHGVHVDEVREFGRSLVERLFRVGLAFMGDDAMVGKRGMRNQREALLEHVAARTIVGRSLAPANEERHGAARFLMTAQAALPVVARRVRPRLLVRIVAGEAAHPAATRAIALAEDHQGIVFEQRRCRRRIAAERQSEDRDGAIKRRPRPEVVVVPAGLGNSSVAALVAVHADVVGEPAG